MHIQRKKSALVFVCQHGDIAINQMNGKPFFLHEKGKFPCPQPRVIRLVHDGEGF